MHTFLWSGRDPKGRKRSERVLGENAQAVRAQLEERGWTGLELITDEVIDISRKHMSVAGDLREAVEESADAHAARWKNSEASSFLAEWWKTLRQSGGTFALFGIVAALGVFAGRSWAVYLGLGVILLFTLLFPVLFLLGSKAGRIYDQLNRAKVLGRWQEVLDCVDRLRELEHAGKLGIGEVELTRNRALALAGLGQLDLAVKEYSALEKLPSLPRWLYLTHLAAVYDAAHDSARSTELRRQAAEEKPDTGVVWLDLALTLAQRRQDTTEARQALARATTLEVPAFGRPYFKIVEGIILWREGKLAEAKARLEEALSGLRLIQHHAAAQSIILITKSYLCATHRAVGNHAQAAQLLRETEAFLTVHKEDELLQACRGAGEAKRLIDR